MRVTLSAITLIHAKFHEMWSHPIFINISHPSWVTEVVTQISSERWSPTYQLFHLNSRLLQNDVASCRSMTFHRDVRRQL